MSRIFALSGFLLGGLFVFMPFCSHAQVNSVWVRRYQPAPKMDGSGAAIALDASGNVYVTGRGGTRKYDSLGNEQWKHAADNRLLALDNWGHVYVANSMITTDNNKDFLLTCLDTSGRFLWEAAYNSKRDNVDDPVALAVDARGNAYLTGASFSDGNFDYATLKFDTLGNLQWVRNYASADTISDADDLPTDLAVDAAGNVYVTGSSPLGYATVKYDADGVEQWTRWYHPPGNISGYAYGYSASLAVDASGNLLVTGSVYQENQRFDIGTMKYDAEGHELWSRTYNSGEDQSDVGSEVKLDAEGNVYVAGRVSRDGFLFDWLLIKYDPSGTELWQQRYPSGTSGGEPFPKMESDATGTVFLCGYQVSETGDRNYLLLAYDPQGNKKWAATYDGLSNGDDVATCMAIAPSGDAFISGYSKGLSGFYEAATIRYSERVALLVQSFDLINAGTDKLVQPLGDGAVFNLADIRGRQINIRANTNSGNEGQQVLLELSGPQQYQRLEGSTPYALFGNMGTNYHGKALVAGEYTLTATPLVKVNGSEQPGISATIHFTVEDKLSLAQLTLVDAAKNTTLSTLIDGAVIDLAKTPSINIGVKTGLGFTESVGFSVNGSVVSVENTMPFALASDNGGDYFPWKVGPGTYVITATPYSGNFAKGKAGAPLSVSITIIDSRVTFPSVIAHNDRAPGIPQMEGAGLQLQTYPNPVGESGWVQFGVDKTAYLSLQLVDVHGKIVAQLFTGRVAANGLQRVELPVSGLAPGLYFCRLVGAEVGSRLVKVIKR